MIDSDVSEHRWLAQLALIAPGGPSLRPQAVSTSLFWDFGSFLALQISGEVDPALCRLDGPPGATRAELTEPTGHEKSYRKISIHF